MHQLSLRIFLSIFGISILFIFSCEFFKTKYEEIPPEFPDLNNISIIDSFDYNYSISDLQGNEITLAKFKNKVLFLNVWGTWCVPCRAELPGLQKLFNTIKNDEIEFFFISNESISTLTTFLDSTDYTIPVYMYTDPLPLPIKVSSFPTTFIIDKSGNIVFKYKLSAKWDDISTKNFLIYLITNGVPNKSM